MDGLVVWIHHCNFSMLRDNQRLNHFPNHYEFTRKDLLYKTLRKYKRHLERNGKAGESDRLNFFPLTYILPQDYGMFREEFKRHQGALWIAKPLGQAQGRGIFLVSKLAQLSEWRVDNRQFGPTIGSKQPSIQTLQNPDDQTADQVQDENQQKEKDKTYLVQKYIDNPFLVGGKKFDLRIYVLVTSFLPLTVWLYRTGFARFSFHRFSMDSADVENSYVHLTNVAIQKHSPTYDPTQGCKWDLRQLKGYIASRYSWPVANKLFYDIQQLLILVLQAAQQVIIHDRHCFEMYGFDVLIDSNLKPWLLEVNASPSLTADTPMDYHLKYVLLNDMFDVVDLENKKKGKGSNIIGQISASSPPTQSNESGSETNVGGFDLVYKGNAAVPCPFAPGLLSQLGTCNDLDRFPHELPERLKNYEKERLLHLQKPD
ncbi:MAG: putative tubulin polyglutamylase TTLL9 [Streblomastix strix]|uniref:Tubulin--tyrosine ligase-like protein 9 n=1 Tax=Streblomastix strix TaxID=222440 RepID=A0A5J4UUV1_9EUKA|nr:MAG: putative tubulin polyglutamylase TTLL9 [Streblomastix strix]